MTGDAAPWASPVSCEGGAESDPPSARVLGFAYAANFAALASSSPFFALYLADRGFRAEHVSWILGALLLVNVVATVAWTRLADAIGSIGRVLRAVSFAAVACAALAFSDSPAMLVVAGLVLFAACRAPFGALLDALALSTGRRFGPIRAWGTAGYVVGALVTGALTARVGSRGVVYATAGLLVLAAFAALGVPPRNRQHVADAMRPLPPVASPSRLSPLAALLARPRFLLLLSLALLSEVGLAPYDALFPAYLARLSDPFVASLAVAVGAVAELVFLAAVAPRLNHVRPAALLTLASGVSIVRWGLVAWVTAPAALVATQLLHSVSFGAFYLGSITLVNDETPPSLRAAGQGIFRAFAFGLAPAAALAVAGRVEHAYAIGLRAVFVVAATAAAVACALAWRTESPRLTPSDRT